MYRIYLNQVENEYHYAELVREFLPEEAFEVIPGTWIPADSYHLTEGSYMINRSGGQSRDENKAELYRLLETLTGIHPEWGTLTGVRPLKLARQVFTECSCIEETVRILKDHYLLDDGKAELLARTLRYQQKYVSEPDPRNYSMYVGIPFCPSICSYCSFSSTLAREELVGQYLDRLLQEIRYAGQLFQDQETELESVYIGGGTPTTLAPAQLEILIRELADSFHFDPGELEFTVEAGRPDTVTEERLRILRDCGVSRISINPQSMKDETLRRIGRSHRPQDIVDAFRLAKRTGFEVINSDLIAGLPGETSGDFVSSLDQILALGADNITVHTLSVKRGSRLKEQDPEYYRRSADTVSEMLAEAERVLEQFRYYPYYLYRQKHQIGSFENTGWCLEEKHSLYNIRIMEDKQTILALGAGAVGKVYYPEEDRLERIANISDVQTYLDRFDSILERKHAYFR